MVGFYLYAHQGLNGENAIQEEHAVSLNQLPLILKGAGQNGEVFSERRINNALFKKFISLLLFLLGQLFTDPKENVGKASFILGSP